MNQVNNFFFSSACFKQNISLFLSQFLSDLFLHDCPVVENEPASLVLTCFMLVSTKCDGELR